MFLIFKVAALRRMARLEPEEMAFTPRFIQQKLTTAGFCQVSAITRDFLLPNTPARLISVRSQNRRFFGEGADCKGMRTIYISDCDCELTEDSSAGEFRRGPAVTIAGGEERALSAKLQPHVFRRVTITVTAHPSLFTKGRPSTTGSSAFIVRAITEGQNIGTNPANRW